MKTCCCSSHCKKYFDCQLADINNEGMNIVENYHEWGSCTYTDEGCVIEHYCGELGDYKMFEPIEKGCSGCAYEDADGSTSAISNCVCCSRNIEYAKNDYYRKK